MKRQRHVQKLVARLDSLGRLMVEAMMVTGSKSVLFNSLDIAQIRKGLRDRKIGFAREVLLEDHTCGMMRSRMIDIGKLSDTVRLKDDAA